MAPPNILVFLMDDMGIGDSRVYNKNSKVSMPNLEKLAAAGMTFTDAHAPAAVCAPTRYSVMTGNYPWRGRNPNGTWLFNMPSQVLSGQQTVGQLMKKIKQKAQATATPIIKEDQLWAGLLAACAIFMLFSFY